MKQINARIERMHDVTVHPFGRIVGIFFTCAMTSLLLLVRCEARLFGRLRCGLFNRLLIRQPTWQDDGVRRELGFHNRYFRVLNDGRHIRNVSHWSCVRINWPVDGTLTSLCPSCRPTNMSNKCHHPSSWLNNIVLNQRLFRNASQSQYTWLRWEIAVLLLQASFTVEMAKIWG